MIRLLLAAALVLPALLLAAAPSSTATACSIGPPLLGEIAAASDFIALVDILEVGGRENPQPTLPPDPTFTPSATHTVDPPPPTRRPFESTPLPATSVLRPTHTPVDLIGIGARARIVQSIVGQPAGDIDLDGDGRRDVERAARKVEALDPILTPPCDVTIGYAHFEPGRRYLVFATSGGSRVQWWNPVVAGSPSAPHLDGTYGFMLPRATFDRFFPPAPPGDYTDDGSGVFAGQENMPLSLLLALVADIRGDSPTIIPPTTGTAGLR